MATEADIAETVSITRNVGESIYLERLVDDTIPGEVKKFQEMLNLPPETAQHSAETENRQAAFEPETMITVIEGNVEAAKGEKFFESPCAVEVASEETCRVSKHLQDEEAPIQGEKEISEDEKQVSIEKIEVGDETGSGGIKIMPEPEEIPEKNDMSSDIVNHSGNGFQMEKTEESNLRIEEEILKEERVADQHAEVIIDQDVSIEDKNIEKETIDMHKNEKDGILEATGETSSEEVEYKEAEKSTYLFCQEKTPEAIDECERVENEKDEKEISVYDNAGKIFTPSIAAHADIQSDKKATLNIRDVVEETVCKPSITTATDVSSRREVGPEAGEELKEADGFACEEKAQDVTEPSEEIKYMTQVEGEMSPKDSMDTFATQTEDKCSEKIDNPEPFKAPHEIHSDDIIKENPKEVKEQIEVIEKAAEDDSISSEKEKDYENPEQEGDASFVKHEGTLSVKEVAAGDASSVEKRYEEAVIETKEKSGDAEIINALEHNQEERSSHEERQENLQQNEQEEEKLERSMSVVSEDFIVSASTEHTEPIACVKDEEPIKVQEESFEVKITDVLEHRKNGRSELEERQENLQQNKPEKEKIEESSSVAAEDISIVAPAEPDETRIGVEGQSRQTPFKSREETCKEIVKEDLPIHSDSSISENETAEDKNIQPIELNEKIERAQTEVPNTDANGLHVTDPLIEAAVENEGKDPDNVSNSETEGQVQEANEASAEEKKDIEDAPEAHQSGNCTISEHPSTEGGVTTELILKTSETEVEKLQEVCGLESEEKSEIKDSEENAGREMQNNEEACDTVAHERVAESGDAVKCTTRGETSIEVDSAVFTRDDKVEQELQTESPLEAAPTLIGEDKSHAEDTNKSSNVTNEEVLDEANITGSGVPVNEQVVEGIATHISEEATEQEIQEIDQVTPENENDAEKSEGENIIEQTLEESNPASVEQIPEDLPTGEIYETSKTEAEAESIGKETSKTTESSEEITASETSVEEKPHKNEPGEKLEPPFSSNENETLSSDADKIPCLTEDGAPQKLEEAPQEGSKENNNAKENKITAEEEDLQAVAETSDATEIDNKVTEDEIKKEESKELKEDGNEAGKQTLKEENLVDQSSELEAEKIEQSVNADHAVACISPEAVEKETVEITEESSVKQIPEETNIAGHVPESVEQVPSKNIEDNEKKTEDSKGEIFENSRTEETAKHIENDTSDSTQEEEESVRSEERNIAATESSPEEKPQENEPEEKLERTFSPLSRENETVSSDASKIQCQVEEGASQNLEEVPQNKEKETEANKSAESKALEPQSEMDNIAVEDEIKKEESEKSEDSKGTEEDEETEKHDSVEDSGVATILPEPIGEKVLPTSEEDKKEEEPPKFEIYETSKTEAEAESIEKETSKTFESSEEITATETSVQEKPHKNEPGEKLEPPFSSSENETLSSDADKIPCLTEDGDPQNLEEAPQKTENEEGSEENNNAKEIKIPAEEEDLQVVAETSDATRSAESIALELKSELDNTVIEEEIKKEESKKINEDGKEAGKQTLEEENLVDQSSELEVEKIEQSVKEDDAVACISPESAEQETVEVSEENSVKQILEETNIVGHVPESAELVPSKNMEDDKKKAEDSTGEIFEHSKTEEEVESIENETSDTIECPEEILDTRQGKQQSEQSEEKNITVTESSPEEKPQENEPGEKLERTLSLLSVENETSLDANKIQCLVEEGASQNLEEAPENEAKETEEENDTKENKLAPEDVQVLDETTEASKSQENIALEPRSEIDNIAVEEELRKESSKESEDLKETKKDEETEKHDSMEGGAATTILPEASGEKLLQSSEVDEKEEEKPNIEVCGQLETTSVHEDAEKQTPEEESIVDKTSELEGKKIEQGLNEDHAVACITSESVEQEIVQISGENSVKQTLEETNITGQLPESVEEVPFKNTEDNEKKAEDSTGEIVENSKTEEEAESIENETSRTINYPEENVQTEGENKTAAESSLEEKSQENESGEKIGRTLPLVSEESESFSSDANKIQCLVEESASQSLEETPESEEKERVEDNDTKESEIATEEDLQVLDETTEASENMESIAPELQSEIDNKAVEDELRKEECRESEELKDTERDEETEQQDSAEECSTATILPEPIGEKVLQTSEEDEKEEQTPKIEASAQLETINVHEDAEKQTPDEENVADQPSVLVGEKIEQGGDEVHAVACIPSESVEQETVEISGENSVKLILEDINITGHLPESVDQAPSKYIEDNEKKPEDSTGEIIENVKTEEEESESIENETSRTTECPREILDTAEGNQEENVQSEGKNITATESSTEEKSQENEPEEKIERTLPLVSDENESFSSDDNKIQCLVEEGASPNLEEVPQSKEKETEASKSTESKALEPQSEIEIKEEESEESVDLKGTEEDEETEKHDLMEDSDVTTILPERIGEKVLQSSEEDKKEEEKPKIEVCAELEPTSVDEDTEKETLKVESIVDQSRELDVEKIEQSSREEETTRIEACSQLKTTSVDEDAGKEDLEKENIVEQSREPEIEKIEESSREDNAVAYISLGLIEQQIVKVSQGNENKAEESEGENNREQMVEESSMRGLTVESVQQVPIDDSINEEKKTEETTGENFENSKMVEAVESTENETSKTIESPKEILDTTEGKQGEDVQSEGKNITAAESSPEEKAQENEPREKLEQSLSLLSTENEASSDANKIQCLVKEVASHNLEEDPQNEGKGTEEENDTKENKLAVEEDVQILDATTEASKNIESIGPELHSEIDNKAVQDERKEESKESEELTDTEKQESAEGCGTATNLAESIGEKVRQNSEEDEKVEQTPKIEARPQVETIIVHEDAGNQTPEEENIDDQASELEGEKIEQSVNEDHAVACTSSELVEEETAEISGKNSVKQILEGTNITGQVQESVEQVPFKNIEDNEKEAEDSTREIIENAKIEEEEYESIENETSRTIECPEEIPYTTQENQGGNLQSEESNITATEFSPEEKSQQNESGEEIERTLPLFSNENKSFTSDANKIQALVEEGASGSLEEVPQNKEKETEASKSTESKALEPQSEIDNIAVEDEIKKEESEKSVDLKGTEEDEETEKHDSMEDSGVTTNLPEPIGEKVLQTSEEDKKEEERPKFEVCTQLETTSLDEDAKKETLKEEIIVDQSRVLEVEKFEQSSREEGTPSIETCSHLETTSVDEDAGKEDLEKEIIVDLSRELEIEKIEERSKEDNAVAYISSESIEQDIVEVSQGNENRAEESEVPIDYLINEEKKPEETTGENFEYSKTVEAAESIENVTSKTIESHDEILDITQGKRGGDVQSEGKNITATESFLEEEPRENEAGEKLEGTLSLVSGQNETLSSDANKIQCLVEDGASQNLEEAKGNEEKEIEVNTDTKENQIASEKDLEVLDETTEASKSTEIKALAERPETNNIAVEDEIKKEESKESEELDTEKDDVTEKQDLAEECGTATILPEPIGEKLLQSDAEDKKEEETPKFEACEQLEPTSVDKDAEKQTLKEETIVDLSRELEVEKTEKSSTEEETPRTEACSQAGTTGLDENAGKEDLENENMVERSRELEIEKIEECTKEDDAVAYISSGEQETVEISQGNEKKAAESEGENNVEQILEESSISGLMPESVQQVPTDKVNEEKKEEENTGENFEKSKTLEATESIENETSKTFESPKVILDTIQEKQDGSIQSEIQNPDVAESTLEKLEHETTSSDGDKISCLMEEEAPQDLEEVPEKEENEKEAKDNNETEDSKIAIEKDLEVVTETSDEGNSTETIVLKPKSEADNVVIEDEPKKEEAKQLYEDFKEGVNGKHEITEECSTENILPEPSGEKMLPSPEEDKKEEETPKIEACTQLETTSVDEGAVKQKQEEESIIDQSRELESEKIEQSSREEETPKIEACSQLERTSVDEAAEKEDLEKEDIVDQSRELEIETVAHISSESIEQETVEIPEGNEKKAEKSEGKDKIEQIIEESSTRGLIPEPVQQVPLNNSVEQEKKAEETSVETFENSKKEEAAGIIAHEISETTESNKEILDTFQVTQVESLESEGKNQTATESSAEEKINEDRSPVKVADENSNDSEQVDDKDNTEMKVSKGEDDIEQRSPKNEPGEEIEKPLSLISDESQEFSSDVSKIPDLMEEASQNPKEAQKKEENEKETEENNDTEDNKVPKEEDLQVADEQSDTRKSTDSITLEQKLELGHTEVEEKKEVSKELYGDCSDAGKDKETEKHETKEECSSTNVLPEPIEEKACVPLETTSRDEDAERQTLKENIVEESRELDVALQQISKEDDSAAKLSKQEGCEAAQTVDGDEDAGKQEIGAEAENKSEALETADAIPSREKQDIEEENIQDLLCSSVKEETVEESSQEDETKAVKLKEEVDESNSSSIEKTEVTSSAEETVPETLHDSAESKATEEETPPKEIHGGPVEKSMVLDVSDQDKEITAKEETNIDDTDSASVKVVTEEMCLQEAAPEDKKEIESFGPFQEKSIVETEAKEIMLEYVDNTIKPEDISNLSNLGEKREKQIPPAAEQAKEEINHKTENEVPHAGSEDQKEKTTNELSLKEISKEMDYSAITSEENELMTSKASEALDKTTAESHAPYEDTQTTSVAQAIDTVVMEKQDRTCLSNVSELEPVDTGKGIAAEEVKQERVHEDLNVHPELDHEKSLTLSEDVQTSEGEETRELAVHSDGCTSKTLEDVESSNVTPNIDEAQRSTETSCAESKKSILEEDILKGSSEEGIEVGKAAIELKEEAYSHRQEDMESNDTGTKTEEILKLADPEEKLQHDSEVVAGDQSNEILPQSDKSQMDESCNGNQIQEDEKEIKEKEEQKLEVEDQKEQNANETVKAVLITEKVHEGVAKCDDSEDIKELVAEEDQGFEEIHALHTAGETTDKVQDSSLVYAKVEDSKEKTETENSEVEEVSTKEREAFFAEQPEKQKVEDSSTCIEPPGEESKEKIEEEVEEESQDGYSKIDHKTPTTVTETSPEEAELGDKLVKAFHTDLDEPCLETTEIMHSQQSKEVDSMKLEEASCELASELQTRGHGHAESAITTENTDMGEPEEIKTASEAVYESKSQVSEETVEKPDQVSTDDLDNADRKNVVMENSDTDEVDASKLALDAVDKTQDQGAEGAAETHTEEDSLAPENLNSVEFDGNKTVCDAMYESKDQGSEDSAGKGLVVEEPDQIPTEEKLDVDKSEGGSTETTDNGVQGVEPFTEDEITAKQTPSGEKLEEQLLTPASDLPLEHETTTTVEKIEEEKTDKMEMLEIEGSEDSSTAKPAEEISLQNDRPGELEVPTPESTIDKDIEDSPTEVLVHEEGRQTSDDGVQLEPPENEKIKFVESGESLTAGKPGKSEEACKEKSEHKAQGVDPATEGETTAEQTPLTEKFDEQPVTPASALPFMHGTTTTVESIEEEKTEKMETLEEEGLEDSSAAKQAEDMSLLKVRARELEVPALGSASNEDIKDSLTEVLVHEEGGQTPDGTIQVEPSGNETTAVCVDTSLESKEIIDLSRPAETAFNLKPETNDKGLEPELVIHMHEVVPESQDTGIQEKHLEVIADESDEENQSKKTSEVKQIIQNEVSKEEITEAKEVEEKYQLSSICGEKLNESIQEDELKPEECKGETTNRTTETTVTRIQDEELSGETEKAVASETIGKQLVFVEDRSVEDLDQVLVENKTIKESFAHEFEREDVVDSAIDFDPRNQGEESIKGFEEESKVKQQTQQLEKTSSATTEKQIPTEADIIQCQETIVSTGHEYVSPVLLEVFTETSQKVEAEDLKPGNSEGLHSVVKEVEHGGEKRTDVTEEETTDKSTLVDPDKPSLSDLSERSTKETIQLAKDVTKEKEPTASTEELHTEAAETITVKEEKSFEERDEAEGDEHQKTDSGSDAPVMVEASRDIDVKVTHKKSHGILSGVGSKVKHSISKVKKAITGKSSHHSKPVSPK